MLLRDLFNDRLVKRLRALRDQMLRADRLAHHAVNQVSVFGPLALLHQVGRALCVARRHLQRVQRLDLRQLDLLR